MAITTGVSPFVLDAQGDDIASVFQGRDMNNTTPVVRIMCSSIRYKAGASGRCLLLNRPGGNIIYESPDIGAGEENTITFDGNNYLNGVYVQELPAGGRVYVYYV